MHLGKYAHAKHPCLDDWFKHGNGSKIVLGCFNAGFMYPEIIKLLLKFLDDVPLSLCALKRFLERNGPSGRNLKHTSDIHTLEAGSKFSRSWVQTYT